MTHEDDTRDLVRRAGDAFPVTPAPAQDLLRQGRRARRRRTRTVVGAVAAAVVIVTGGAVAVGSQLTNDASTNPIVGTPTVTPPGPTTPLGTRLVGRNGIGIAVPIQWGTNDAACHSAFKDTVIVGANPGVDCSMFVPPPVSWAVLDSYESSIGELTQTQGSNIQIGGLALKRVRTYQYQQGENGANTMYAGALLSRDLDIAIIVRSPDRTVVDDILASAFAVPSRYVAVPALAGRADLVQRGLVVHHETSSEAGLPPGRLLAFDPPPGSIVPAHSVVTVIRSGTTHDARACSGLQTSLITPTRDIHVVARLQPYHAVLHVGDRLSLEASGPCARDVDITPRQTGVMEIRGDRRNIAVHSGTATVDVGVPPCFSTGGFLCTGGNALLAQVRVVVLP
jgi:hypothetical protein